MRFCLGKPGSEALLSGSSPALVVQGVFLSVGPDSEGYNKVTHIRFARQRFSKAAADDWWHAHKHDLARKYNLRSRSSPEQPETSTVRPPLPGSQPWTPRCLPLLPSTGRQGILLSMNPRLDRLCSNKHRLVVGCRRQ